MRQRGDISNQRRDHSGSTLFADDDVNGYTLEQIQIALDHKTSLDGVGEYLKDKYSNLSEAQLKKLIGFYTGIKNDNK